MDQSISMNVLIWRMPRLVKLLVLKTIGRLLSPTSAYASIKGHHRSRDLWTSHGDLTAFATEILQEWDRLKLDVVIAPGSNEFLLNKSFFRPKITFLKGFAFSAPFLADPPRSLPAVIVPGAYNVLDFPAGVVPFGHARKEDEEALAKYPTRVKGFDLMYEVIKRAARGSEGLPIGVQVKQEAGGIGKFLGR